jgi:carbamoyl-phosphate synthase small subunit
MATQFFTRARRASEGTPDFAEITSQNHNFAVDAASIEGVADVTHVNLNDGVCEGMRVRSAPAYSVQHHPEASPGPHDSAYLFDEFDRLMERGS